MVTQVEIATGLRAAMELPFEPALRMDYELGRLPGVCAVMGCLLADGADLSGTATRLYRQACRARVAVIVAPWAISSDAGEVFRGAALWPLTEATQKIINGGTIT